MKMNHTSGLEDVLQMVRQRAASDREEAVARRLAGSEARRLYMQTLNNILESHRERGCSFRVPPPAHGGRSSSAS